MTRALLTVMLFLSSTCGVGCAGKPAPARGNGAVGGASVAGASGNTGTGGVGAAFGSGGTGGSPVGPVGGSGATGGAGVSATGGGIAPGTGGHDAGPGPLAGCKSGTYLLCEDFEATAVNGIPTGWTKHGGSVSVADDQAASGSHSLKIGPADNGERRIYHDATALPSTHWGRVRFKVQTPVPDAFVHSTMVTFSGRSPKPDMDNLEVRVVDTVKQSVSNGSHYQVLYNVQPQSRAEFAHGSSYDWKFDDAWHCAEWYIDSAQQAYKFWLDGKEITSVAFSNGAGKFEGSEIPSVFSDVRVGWNNYQSAPPGFTAWLDDFAMASQRIPCQ